MHPAFKPISYKGIPDIRVVLYKNEPAMAMLRLPTRASGGRANLHQGGIGAGIDLETGRTNNAALGNRFTQYHPDTDMPLVGFEVPYWPHVLEMSRQVNGMRASSRPARAITRLRRSSRGQCFAIAGCRRTPPS